MRKLTLHLATQAARWLPNSVKKIIYRIPWLAKWVRSSLNQAAPPGLTQVQIAAGLLAGATLKLDLHSEKDYWLGTYEADLQQALLDWVRPGMVAYDVGANIGYISLSLARVVGSDGLVFSFEAFPENVQRLRTNISLNPEGAWIEVFPAAVVNRGGMIEFQVGPSGGTGKVSGSTGRQSLAYQTQIRVPALALDQLVFEQHRHPPQVIKLDIEGGEVLALPGMYRVLSEYRPLIFLELHGPEAARVSWQTFRELNYRHLRMQVGYPEITVLEEMDWKAYVIAQPRNG